MMLNLSLDDPHNLDQTGCLFSFLDALGIQILSNIISSLECDNDVKILGRGSPKPEITVGYLAF